MIKDFKPRLYQETIFSTCSLNNTLVVLPTGLGKTNVFMMVAAKRIEQYPDSKILLLGPTRPLIEQYLNAFKKHFEIDEKKMTVITGMVKPEKRIELYDQSKIIFSTPQCIENDIITEKIDLKRFSLIGFDEAHRATGDYAYNFIAKEYNDKSNYARIVAMTASPGDNKEKIEEVKNNLFIEAVEVKTENDEDVKPYIQKTPTKTIEVELDPEFIEIKKLFEKIIKDKVTNLKEIGLKANLTPSPSKKDILLMQRDLQSKISSGERSMEYLIGLSVLAQIMKVMHAGELIESQGVEQLLTYLDKIFKDANKKTSKAVISLVQNIDFKTAFAKTVSLNRKGIVHPKFKELERLLLNFPEGKKIVFTQFRDTASSIKKLLDSSGIATSEIFVGQAKKNGQGINQKRQKELIERFREDEFEVLIATSVAEEGLDIPKVDLVVFFEPIPSAIRHIQRSGRTGRLEEGKIFILLTKNTRDEAYKWSAYHKENRMLKILKDMQKDNKVSRSKDRKLDSFMVDKKKDETIDEVKVIVDHREKANKIIKILREFGIRIQLESLEIGDYLLSDRVCVEFKTVPDFVDSILDGRILKQLKELRKYEKPIMIVEGTQDLYSQRNINPNAVRGMITTAMINFGIPIYFSKDNNETASIMKIISFKEQIKDKRSFTIHMNKPNDLREMQEYIVSSFPGVGGTLSKPLLKRFRSIKSIVNANEDELKEVELIGEKKAKTIREVLDWEYKEYD